MNVRIEALAESLVLVATGRLDFGAAAAFQLEVEQAFAGHPGAAVVIVDCAALDYVSSAGLRVLLLAARAATRSGIGFGLCALRPAVREVFELSGFAGVIAVYPDRAAAVARAPQPARIERRTAVAAEARELPALTRFLQEFWSAAGLPAEEALSFELALEEVFMNVVMHGGRAPAAPEVEVTLQAHGGTVTLTVTDDGPPFDPLSVPLPDVTAGLEARRVGGLGLLLVRRMMDSVRYARVGTRNQLVMQKPVAAATTAP